MTGRMVLALVLLFLTVGCRTSSESATEGSAPAGSSAPGAPSEERVFAGDTLPALGRLVVREAELLVECRDSHAAARELQLLVVEFGGFVAEAELVELESERAPSQASFRAMVPAQRLEAFLSDVARRPSVERVASERVRSQDVTEETLDLAARLRTFERTEARLLSLLDRAESIDETLRIEQELARVRTEIERMRERQRFLEQRIAYAEVRVLLVPAPRSEEPSIGETVRAAWTASLALASAVLRGALWTTILTWWLWSPLVVTIVALRAWWRRRAWGRAR